MEIKEVARLWAIRVQDPAFTDWDSFTEWLERDPSHLAAYDEALEAADWGAELLASRPTPLVETAAEHEEAPRRRWRLIGGGTAIAAAIAGVASWGVLNRDLPAETIATAPGEQRTVELADGSRIELNGGTRVTIDRDTPRQVALAQGEALFDVRHDESDPFVVMAGGTRLVDAGTVFNVSRNGGELDVAVAEGAVIYQPGAGEVRLNAGDALSRADEKAAPVVRRTAPQAVGSWRNGELQYDGATLEQVARDLSRNLGRPVGVEPRIRNLTFNGTLVLRGPPEEVLASAGPLLGVRFTPAGKGWTMTSADASPR